MVFLRWTCPSPEEQQTCINKSGRFNYDTKYKGASAKPVSLLQEDRELAKDGFLLNHAKVLVGSGPETYENGKNALQTWRHFGMDWTFVDPKTPVQTGVKFCVCVKEFFPWIMMPLQVVYVNENTKAKKAVASFSFGSGILQGHLLAGEERFSIELDENNQVWYEILSFSKPAHFLSVVGYPCRRVPAGGRTGNGLFGGLPRASNSRLRTGTDPYALRRQIYFAQQSTGAVRKHLSSS